MTEREKTRVAVITGAGRGIGREISVSLAEAGYDLVLGWNHGEEAVEITAVLAREAGASVTIIRGDVAKEGTAPLLASAAVSLGGLDLWVNNAGISHLSPVLETSAEDARRLMEVNYLGTFNGVVTAGRTMTTLGGGRIINIASDLGIVAAPLLAAYSASKFAVVGLTQAAAIELAPASITVNALCPGTVETEMVLAEERAEAAIHSVSIDAVRARLLAAVPAGRLCNPSDVAAMVIFMASSQAAYLTGQAICVNGGSILH
jgi:meso-butanediol dehydrogenase/(S,S)-butanediol dehydrogenase/diacetyl reductase